jgi:CelD/BcsL family acetyltransferase involved in cellulose biosynthesis
MADLRILNDLDAIHALVPAWQELVSRSNTASVFQTPEWALGWWRALPNRSTPFCIALFEQERLVGLAPLYIETWYGSRAIRFMGTPHDDPNRALAEPAYARAFTEAFAQGLQQHARDWDVLRLAELEQEETPLARACAQTVPGLVMRELSASNAPGIHLPEEWADYWKRLSSTHRKKMKTYRRKLESHGAVSFQVITEPERLANELPVFFRARWKNWSERKRLNKMVMFQQTATYRDTLAEICVQLAKREHVWLGRLELNAQPVGWILAFRVNNTLSDYMTTFDVAYAACSPGQLVFQELIRYAITQRVQYYQMGRGAQPYKFWFRATAQINKNHVLFWKRPRSLPGLAQQVAREEALKMIHKIRHSRFFSPTRS